MTETSFTVHFFKVFGLAVVSVKVIDEFSVVVEVVGIEVVVDDGSVEVIDISVSAWVGLAFDSFAG